MDQLKRMDIQRFIIFFLICAVCIGLPKIGNSNELTISRVTIDHGSRLESDPEPTIIKFKLSQQSTVDLMIYDSRGFCIDRLLSGRFLESGNHEIVWDGTSGNGTPVPPNFYNFTITASHEKFGKVNYDPTDVTGGEEFQPLNVVLDKIAAKISFFLNKPAIVNLRAGVKTGGPLLSTILDWVPLPAGNHQIDWDGMESSGAVLVGPMENLEIGGSAYTLPMNTIIVMKEADIPVRPVFIDKAEQFCPLRKPSIMKKHEMFNHWQHRRDQCYDPGVALKLLDNAGSSTTTVVKDNGPVKIQVDINSNDQRYMMDQRFEIVSYVDFLFYHEEELGYTPYIWTWNPQGVNPGEHYLTIMLRGYEGHFGTATLKINVK